LQPCSTDTAKKLLLPGTGTKRFKRLMISTEQLTCSCRILTCLE
jgi:hypothetical protein